MEGLTFNFAMLLHGEQEITLHQPIPPEATVINRGRVAELWDKGKACLCVLEVETSDSRTPARSSSPTASASSCAARVASVESRAPRRATPAPDRAADGVVESTTLPQQALIYRLSGDKNPLHADPEFAKMAGFEKPIIHGLCSYGVVCKAIVDEVLERRRDEGRRLRRRASAASAIPGETYLTSYWQEDDRIVIEAKSKERDEVVISNAAITLRS